MGYLLAAAGGALLVVVVQMLARRSPTAVARAAALRWTLDPGASFRRYVGLIVPDERGTTEIDEVLVTPAGVFVIEKKDINAWIFGNESDEYWTAVYPNREKHRFQNPLRQNYRHVKALESFLGVPRSMLSSVIAFSHRSRLMTALPPEVLSSDHVAFVRSHKTVVLSREGFESICSYLDSLEAASDGASRDRHARNLHERFDSLTRCPKCGGSLVQRQSRTLGDEENLFLGCSNFPSCRYVRHLVSNREHR